MHINKTGYVESYEESGEDSLSLKQEWSPCDSEYRYWWFTSLGSIYTLQGPVKMI